MFDWLTQFFKQPEPKKSKVVDMMKDDVDPSVVNIENAYKTRWIWYHTILAIGIFMTNIVLIAILVLLAIKLQKKIMRKQAQQKLPTKKEIEKKKKQAQDRRNG